MNEEAIKNQAKEIIDKFAKKLAIMGGKGKEKPIEREETMRKEGNKSYCLDEEGRKIMFENSPDSEGDYIKAEKGEWI